MINLLDAFAEFVSAHPDMSKADKQDISGCLRNLLDADPEKEIMRRALEHYANEFNWPYAVESEGGAILGMQESEAILLARNALSVSQLTLETCLLSMYDDKFNAEIDSNISVLIVNRVA
jgi:hypothetical protein